MSVLIILNDAPYGSERSCDGLRLAIALSHGEPENEAGHDAEPREVRPAIGSRYRLSIPSETVENPALVEIATKVREMLRQVIDEIG